LAGLKGKVHDALYKKSNWLERIRDKTIMRTPHGMMACSVLLVAHKPIPMTALVHFFYTFLHL
jgi:hypothetical protein